MKNRLPRIVHGVPGPSGEPGLLLLVPPSEALDWDIRHEVASTGRHWMADRRAWWVASPYAATVTTILVRIYGPTFRVAEFGVTDDARGLKPLKRRPARRNWRWMRRVRARLRLWRRRDLPEPRVTA